MLQSVGSFFARIAREITPNPFVFAILLTGVVYLLGVTLTDSGPFEMVQHWYGGFWNLLGFAMQMVIILVAGYVLATSPPVRRATARLAAKPRNAREGILMVAVVTVGMGWVNWGLGVVTGAVLAIAVSDHARRRGIRIHYPLAAAAGYTAMLIFGGGLSSSAALLVNTEGHFLQEQIGLVPVGDTILSPFNLVTCAVFLLVIPLVLAAMHPPVADTLEIGPHLMAAFEASNGQGGAARAAPTGGGEPEDAPRGAGSPGAGTGGGDEVLSPAGGGGAVAALGGRRVAGTRIYPDSRDPAAAAGGAAKPSLAERLDRSPVFSYAIAAAGLGFAAWYFATRGLDLNIDLVNFLLIMVGLVVYGSPIAYVQAVEQAVRASGGIVLQFPFYAGIMGMMSESGLVPMFANAMVAVSNEYTFPLASFVSAAVVNVAIPSAGGQWAVQGPILTDAARTLGVPMGPVVMAFAYGDGLTNMIQPFWALPLLGITQLNARDLLGYTAVAMLVASVIFGFGVTVLPHLLGI